MILHTSQNTIIMLHISPRYPPGSFTFAHDIHYDSPTTWQGGNLLYSCPKKFCFYNAFAGCVSLVLDSTAVCILITFTVTVIDVTSTNSKLLSYVGSIAIGKCCPM